MTELEKEPAPKKKPRHSVAENLVFRTPFICIICFLLSAVLYHYGIGFRLGLLVLPILSLSIPISAGVGLVACCLVWGEPTLNAGLITAAVFTMVVNLLSILIWTSSIRFFWFLIWGPFTSFFQIVD